MTSLTIPQNDIEVGQIDKSIITPEIKEKFSKKAKYIEAVFKGFGYRIIVKTISVERYFVIFYLHIPMGLRADKLLSLKNDFKVCLGVPYLKFYVPKSDEYSSGIGLEVPNLITVDNLIREEIKELTLPDFIFIKIYTMIVKSQVINTLYLSEELEISESRVKRYLKDMQKLNIISENGKFLEETDIDKAGYYWKRWRRCNL